MISTEVILIIFGILVGYIVAWDILVSFLDTLDGGDRIRSIHIAMTTDR